MAFNKDAFLQTVVEAKLDTARIPWPEGDCETLIVRDVDIKSGKYEKGDRKGQSWVQLVVKISTTDANVANEMQLSGDQEPICYWQEFLDLDENGNLATGSGKNVKLGKLRAACGQNSDDAWSIVSLKGATLGGTIEHKINGDGDPVHFLKSVWNPESGYEEEGDE